MTVEEIARSLTARMWAPSGEEWSLGNALMVRRDAHAPQRPAMPHRDGGVPWTTQSVVWTTGVVRIVDELLAERTERLRPGSPMVQLLQAYAAPARGLERLADGLQQAWESSPPAAPTWEAVQERAQLQDLVPERAWLYLAWEAMQAWEDRHLPTSDRERSDSVTLRMMQVGAVIAAAVSGDVDL